MNFEQVVDLSDSLPSRLSEASIDQLKMVSDAAMSLGKVDIVRPEPNKEALEQALGTSKDLNDVSRVLRVYARRADEADLNPDQVSGIKDFATHLKDEAKVLKQEIADVAVNEMSGIDLSDTNPQDLLSTYKSVEYLEYTRMVPEGTTSKIQEVLTDFMDDGKLTQEGQQKYAEVMESMPMKVVSIGVDNAKVEEFRNAEVEGGVQQLAEIPYEILVISRGSEDTSVERGSIQCDGDYGYSNISDERAASACEEAASNLNVSIPKL